VLGFNVLSGVQPLGAGTNIMDLEDFIVSNNLLPLGSLGYVLFCTHKNGWGWEAFIEEANKGQGMRFPKLLKSYVAYVIPVIIAVIYLKGYWDFFAKAEMTVRILWMVVAVVLLGFVFFCALHKKKEQE
ncbi:MAG: sodium-dependent transporter, partial [Lachnospiraceae bacterium]|nr:sodium-dependent transporter [Lachnospiraceae bacterium]